MEDVIKADLFRYFGKTGKNVFFRGWQIPGFRFSYFLRKAAAYPKRSVAGLFYRFFLRRYRIKYGIHISADTKIGSGLQIYHNGCIVVNPKAVIGNNCTIGSCVTIGQANRGRLKGCPTLGNGVFLGAGAVVVGKVTVGDNVMIAPNAFVNFDVPSNSIVIGNPAKVVSDPEATAGYVENTLDRRENSYRMMEA